MGVGVFPMDSDKFDTLLEKKREGWEQRGKERKGEKSVGNV